MRIFLPLFASRGTPKEPVPFQEILPLKLRAGVSGKGDRTSEVCCIQEMSIMLACFKANEFDQSLCSKEVSNFQKCYSGHLKNKQLRKEQEERGILVPGERKLSPKQVNVLLKRFPDVKF